MKKTSEDLFCLDPTKLSETLGKIDNGTAVTHGECIVDSVGCASDHAWNQMDQEHRPWIHNTYTEALRIARGKNFAVSLTKFKVGFLKFSIMVTDVFVSKSLSYQSYSIFNVIYVHNLTHNLDKKIHVEWYLVSNKFFKFLHPLIHWRLNKLNQVQIKDDVKIIDQRTALRKMGYNFDTDNPDYLNSNSIENGVFYPASQMKSSFDLTKLPEGVATKVLDGVFQFLVEKKGAELSVWPAICPHQGAELTAKNKCGKKIQCQWHGLKISGVTLSRVNPNGIMNSFQLYWQENNLVVSKRVDDSYKLSTTETRRVDVL